MTRPQRELVGYGSQLPKVSWPDEARVAISFVLNFEEGSERTPLYGDAMAEPTGEGFLVPRGKRDVRNESAFDYGTRVGYWRVMDLFDKYDLKVTFFAAAMAFELNPEAAAECTARGHEPASHGYRWLPFITTISVDEEREHIRKVVEITKRTTGEAPLGWFSRGPSEQTRELLIESGSFLYDCDSFSDDLPYFVERSSKKWLVIPYTSVVNDMNFWRPPGYGNPNDFYVRCKNTFDRLYDEGASQPQMMSVGLHLRGVGRPSRLAALEQFIRYVRGFPGVWVTRRRDIANWWIENYSDLPAFKN